jgi:hypothetical protein
MVMLAAAFFVTFDGAALPVLYAGEQFDFASNALDCEKLGPAERLLGYGAKTLLSVVLCKSAVIQVGTRRAAGHRQG